MAAAQVEEFRCFVGGLSWDTTDRGLESAFRPYGSILEAKVVVDRDSGRPKGFGFVTFKDEASMEDAIDNMHGKDLDGRNITVSKAQPKGGPRGGGGGGGGGGGYRGGGERRGGGGGGAGSGNCFKCGESGHWARDCPSGGEGGGRYGERSSYSGGRGSDRSRSNGGPRDRYGSDRSSRDGPRSSRSGPYDRPSDRSSNRSNGRSYDDF